MRETTPAIVLPTAALLALVACGGSNGQAKAKPLSLHFDDMHIAAVPLSEKQAVVEAQNEYSLAKMKRAELDAAYNESATELKVAKNEREQAIISEKSAKETKKAADKSHDVTRINTASSELRRAQLARKAADEKVAYLKARRKYLKQALNAASHDMYAKEAKFEMAKAGVAEKQNIRPPGFEYKTYEEQYKSRSEAAQRAQARAKQSKGKVDAKEKKWKSMQQAAQGGTSASAGGTGN